MFAIEKINKEMLKKASDKYTEIIGQYIIDRCVDKDCEKKVEDGPQFSEVMGNIMTLAKGKKHGSVAVLTPDEVFGVVDQAYSFPTDKEAQFRAIMEESTAKIPMPYKTAPEPAAKSATSKLSLDDFL